MPSVNVPITSDGAIVRIRIGISIPRLGQMQRLKIATPDPVECRLLIDTGASGTCLDGWIFQNLGLEPSGIANIQTPSTSAGKPHVCNEYDVSVTIAHDGLHCIFTAIPVIESSFTHHGIDGLLGRDILKDCLLVYNGNLGICTLSF